MNEAGFKNLREFIDALHSRGEIIEVTASVDPNQELPAIHRRGIAPSGTALLFTTVQRSSFPAVTNLFGTLARTELAFGDRPLEFVRRRAELPHELLPPTPAKLWGARDM